MLLCLMALWEQALAEERELLRSLEASFMSEDQLTAKPNLSFLTAPYNTLLQKFTALHERSVITFWLGKLKAFRATWFHLEKLPILLQKHQV